MKLVLIWLYKTVTELTQLGMGKNIGAAGNIWIQIVKGDSSCAKILGCLNNLGDKRPNPALLLPRLPTKSMEQPRVQTDLDRSGFGAVTFFLNVRIKSCVSQISNRWCA